MSYTQEGRLLELTTPLGTDVLLIRSFSVAERMSQLYSMRVSACVESPQAGSVTPDALIGQRMAVRVQMDEARQARFFHGIVQRMTFLGRDEDFHFFDFDVVPQVWRLSQVVNCRIFQNKSVIDILSKILGEHGVSFGNKTTQSHTSRDYCVQYRESDWDFLSRLMEDEGIFYYFDQGSQQEKLVFSDDKSAHDPCPGGSTAIYRRELAADDVREFVVSNWEASQQMRPGLFSLRDHNFQRPTALLHVSVPSGTALGGSDKLEVFDYPGGYAELFVNPDSRIGDIQPEGDAVVKRRLQADEAQAKTYIGESLARSFTAGFKFTLEEHFVAAQNGDYVLTSVFHQGTQVPGYRTDWEAAVPYRNSFDAIPFAVPYLPPRRTRRPVVAGLQTAVVTGPAGEEIYLDKFGRVKVQFFWDREGQFNETSSAWLRVAQFSAGTKWGAVFHPRIGQEVIVGFLEGDPDQPVVVGCVPNASEMPPYPLPENSTISTIKTYSSKGGSGYNELRFEDKKGSEHVYVHAEKNFHRRVKNNDYRFTGYDSHLRVNHDLYEEIKRDAHCTIGGDQQVDVSGSYLATAGMDAHLKANSHLGAEGGQTVHIKAGMSAVVEAGMSLTLKAGGSFISINPAGVQIQGPMILLNSGGAAMAGMGVKKAGPKKPEEPLSANPGQAPQSYQQGPPVPPRNYSPQALALRSAAQSGAPFCDH